MPNSFGTLRVETRTEIGFLPVQGATVTVRASGSDQVLEVMRTDESGNTEAVPLPAPDVEYSLVPQEEVRPYATYDLTIESPDMETVRIEGTQIFAGQEAIQEVRTAPPLSGFAAGSTEPIEIADNTLWGTFPEKIPEDEVKPLDFLNEARAQTTTGYRMRRILRMWRAARCIQHGMRTRCWRIFWRLCRLR